MKVKALKQDPELQCFIYLFLTYLIIPIWLWDSTVSISDMKPYKINTHHILVFKLLGYKYSTTFYISEFYFEVNRVFSWFVWNNPINIALYFYIRYFSSSLSLIEESSIASFVHDTSVIKLRLEYMRVL